MSVRLGIYAVLFLNSGSTASAAAFPHFLHTFCAAHRKACPFKTLAPSTRTGRCQHSALHPLHSSIILVNSLNR